MLIPQYNQLFRNEGDGTFIDVSKSTGIRNMPLRVSRGAAFGDYDNDGDVDIFIVNNYAEPTLLRNNASSLKNSNNWLQVDLIGTGKNRNAVGAKILLKTSNSTLIREIYAGDSYMSSNIFIAQFGLGKTNQVRILQVIWTDGEKQTVKDISVNQLMKITQEP